MSYTELPEQTDPSTKAWQVKPKSHLFAELAEYFRESSGDPAFFGHMKIGILLGLLVGWQRFAEEAVLWTAAER